MEFSIGQFSGHSGGEPLRLFDVKFKEHYKSFILQSVIAAVCIFLVKILAGSISNITVVGSLGASTFIAFAMPRMNASRPRQLIGGYSIGSLCGLALNRALLWHEASELQFLDLPPHALLGGVAVGLALFLMSVLNFAHPPAAALALTLVVESNAFAYAGVAMLSIVFVSLVKQLLQGYLMDLL